MLAALVSVAALHAPPRRVVVQYAAAAAFSATAPALAEPVKLASGVRYTDAKVGTGLEAVSGCRVSVQWLLRRSNGYFVDSSLGALSAGPGGGTLSLGGDDSNRFDPFIFTVGGGGAIAGIDEAILGMKKGGVRRIVVPVALSYTLPIGSSAGPLPEGFGPRRQIERELTSKQDPQNFFFFELEMMNVRPPA